jgi:hypothetical protein
MKKLFHYKKNKSLIKDTDNNLTYTVEVGKGILGLELEIYSDKYCIIDVMRIELKDVISLHDQLIKINNKNISHLPVEKLVKLCKNLQNKNKTIEIMKEVQ